METGKRRYAAIVGTVLAVLASAGLSAGCGSGGEEPPAQGSPTKGEQVVEWNPCSELSSEALRATRVDPGSMDTEFNTPGDKAAIRMCSWNALDGPYYVGVGSTVIPFEQARENTSVTGFQEVQINGRSGLTSYLAGSDKPIVNCYLNMPMDQGMLIVAVNWRASKRDEITESPPCGLAVKHARELEPYLPK